jgi:hypothetical protein
MAFAYSTAVSGAGTVSCASSTTVTGVGTSFAIGLGGVAGANQARVGGTITVGGNTRTIVSIASATSLTVDSAFGTFSGSAFTVQTEIIQTGTDTMNLSLGSATGILITNRQDLYRTFDVRGCDFTVNGTLTVDSTVAQLRNDGSCTNRFTVNGSASGGEIIFNGRRANAGNGPFPYFGFDWLGNNGNKMMRLASTNASFPAKFTMIDSAVRFGSDWLTTDSGHHSRITTQGDECWILCARGTGTSQARIRQDNTTASIDFQAVQTWVGVWLNFGVPQLSLKGYTPINTDGPEINLASVPTATRITIENYNTTYVVANYYAGVQIVLLGSAWTRLKNNLLGTNISWRSSSAVGGRHNVIEFSKQITIKQQDAAGNLLSEGYMYYQPVGSNVAGVRAKGITSDITFDLTQQNTVTLVGTATSEFVYAWAFTTATVNLSAYNYFCSGQTRGSETHLIGSSRYGYDKQYATVNLAGNNDATPTYVHTSLPTSDKVIATAQAITGVTFNFATKVMTITGNLTYQQIYDAYQYALNTTANLFQADNCLTINSTSNYVGWTINVGTGVTLTAGGNFTTLKANSIALTGTAQINGVYSDVNGTSTILQITTLSDGYSLCVFKADGTTKYFGSNLVAGTYSIYFTPVEAGTYYFAGEKYGDKRISDTLGISGGIIGSTLTSQEDVGITDTKATASAYTNLTNTSQIYDATAIFRLTETGIKLGQLVSRDGLYLDFGSFNVKFKDDQTAIISVVSNTITYKSLVMGSSNKYNAMKTLPPSTITPTDTEQINVLIEDANGDSLLTIAGGDNLGYRLYKVPSSAPVDVDPTTGTLLTTLATYDESYRFIGITGFDIVGVDLASKVERRSSMLKGSYKQSFFVGDQIQLDSRALPLLQLIDLINALQLIIDTNLDVKVSTRSTTQSVWEYVTRTLTSSGSSGATLAEIEASTILAKKAQIDALGTPMQADDYEAPDNATIELIKDKVDTLYSYDDTVIEGKLDDIYFQTGQISVKVHELDNYDDTTLQGKVDALGTPLQASSYEAPDNATIGQIKDQVDTLYNYDDTILETKVENIWVQTGSISLQVDALGTPLQADDYIAPDNTKIGQIKTKVDTLANYNDSTLQAKVDNIQSTGATKADLIKLNENVIDASLFFPAEREIS